MSAIIYFAGIMMTSITTSKVKTKMNTKLTAYYYSVTFEYKLNIKLLTTYQITKHITIIIFCQTSICTLFWYQRI